MSYEPIVSIFPLLFYDYCLLLVACQSNAGKQQDPEAVILSSLGFAGLTDSIRQFPKDATLYFRRASLLAQQNQHELALADFKKAWELEPQPVTGARYATTLSITGRSDEAIHLLQQCIGQFPTEPDFKRLLGEAYVQAGKKKEALALYADLLTNDSTDFESWYEKGLLQAEALDTPGAISSLLRAYQLQPVSTYALELAHLYAENRDSKCLDICDAIIQNDSSGAMVDPFFIKGIYYSNTQKYAEAAVQFDSCIRRDWKFNEAYIEKGIAFFKQKNFDEAMNTFRMAATVSNTDPDAYFWTGRCYEAIHKKEEAALNYERALALDKNFTEARDALKRLKE